VTHGNIEFNGKTIKRKDITETVIIGIVQVVEGRWLSEHLTAKKI